MLLLLYHLLWTLPLCFVLPVVGALKKGRFADRLALNLPSIPLGQGNIWVHALSVGEVISAVPLVDALRVRFPDKSIVFTASTLKGISIARLKLADKVKVLITMPVDSWWSIRRIVNFFNPSVFLLIESDIWPALINHLKRRGIKSILINGRVSPKTFRSYQRFSYFARMLFRDLELCLMQSDLDRDRLLKIGINHEKIRTVGNIKFDREWVPMNEEERLGLLRQLRLNSDYPLWVAGSTHPGEEKILLSAYQKLQASFPLLRFIIAPRKIERGDEILKEAQQMGIKAVLKTDLSKSTAPYEVLILNTLGELARIYGLALISFVGGSMIPFGGHNMMEPAGFGCPVLYGPHTNNFILLADLLTESGGGWRVRDEHGLHETMNRLLKDPEMRFESGKKAKHFVDENQGALARVVSYISAHIA